MEIMYVLIIILSARVGGPVAITAQEFWTKKTCETAKEAIEKVDDRIVAVCTPK